MSEVVYPSLAQIEQSQLLAFMRQTEHLSGVKVSNQVWAPDPAQREQQLRSLYQQFHQWSVERGGEDFWKALLDFFPLITSGTPTPVLASGADFIQYGWFEKLTLNVAENLLRPARERPQDVALHFFHERMAPVHLTYGDLERQVYALANAFSPQVTASDTVAAYMVNTPHTVVSMLASSWLGARFTSTSADFGIPAVIDRFGQARPKVLIMCCGYEYGGQYFDLTSRVFELKEHLPTVEKIILVDVCQRHQKPEQRELFAKSAFVFWWDALMEKYLPTVDVPAQRAAVQRFPFQHPLYVMYSSGTTGKPKCLVHSAGGTLLQHVKELGLHVDLVAGKKIFFYTTCGWMMWNWLVSSLALGAEVFLYDGSPTFPHMNSMLHYLNTQQVNIWGTSPKYLRAMQLSGVTCAKDSWQGLETVLSTGSVLLAEQYDYVDESIKAGVRISSISGGTDIISCFILGAPILAVHRGYLQAAGLGMNVACFNDQGKAVLEQEGELVCLTPFVSQPLGLLNDCNDEKLRETYFSQHPGHWFHGDFICIDPQRGIKILGRSDATLNPGGIRIGTGEIYRQTEKVSWIEDALCIAKDDQKGDVEIILFLKLFLPPGVGSTNKPELTSLQKEEVKNIIKKHTTARHVPKRIFLVDQIPYTRSGKKMELAIARLFNGRPITNRDAVSNPECLAQYEDIAAALDKTAIHEK